MTNKLVHVKRPFERNQSHSAHPRPLETVHADHIIISNGIEETKTGQPSPISITLLIDEATRMPTGVGIAEGIAPLRSFLRALKYMLSTERDAKNNWPFGLPDRIYVDRGDMHFSESLASITEELQIQIANVQPTPTTISRKVTNQLPKVGSSLLNIKSLMDLIHAFLNTYYVHNYQNELGDTPANRWQNELESGWTSTIPQADKVQKVFSQLDDENN